jgi:CheY-like chemotaxis protein
MNSRVKRILLVEDSEHDVEMTLEALRESHLANQVDVARDGVEALDYLYRRGAYADRPADPPVFILLDLKMPKLDGIDVLRQLKSDPALRSIPVIILTSSREEQDLVRTYELGINAYVVKPVDFQQFTDSVRKLGFFWAVLNEAPASAET